MHWHVYAHPYYKKNMDEKHEQLLLSYKCWKCKICSDKLIL